MIRKADAVWTGSGRDGQGRLTTPSGVLDGTAYSYKTRFENEKGTNPEELIAAAHAGCFSMALAFGLQAAGFTAEALRTEAAVSLEPEGPGVQDRPLGPHPQGPHPRHRRGEVQGAGRAGREDLPRLQGAERRGHPGRPARKLRRRAPGTRSSPATAGMRRKRVRAQWNRLEPCSGGCSSDARAKPRSSAAAAGAAGCGSGGGRL